MSDEQQIRLMITKQKDSGNGQLNTSSTDLSFDSLESLQRMLSLAGIKSDLEPTQEIPVVESWDGNYHDGDISYELSDIYPKGNAEIWYSAGLSFRDMSMGVDWLKEHGELPTLQTLSQSHVLIGSIQADVNTLEDVFYKMQGENWSPNGEARSMIRALDTHTSMSVGDIVKIGNQLFMVDRFGFEEITNEGDLPGEFTMEGLVETIDNYGNLDLEIDPDSQAEIYYGWYHNIAGDMTIEDYAELHDILPQQLMAIIDKFQNKNTIDEEFEDYEGHEQELYNRWIQFNIEHQDDPIDEDDLLNMFCDENGLTPEYMQSIIMHADKGIHEMQDFENTLRSPNKKPGKDMRNHDEFGHAAPVTMKGKNGWARYGDNALAETLEESKINNLATLLEEENNDDFKSTFTKIANQNYNLSENEIITLANTFIGLLQDKSSSRFNSVKSLINSITESKKMMSSLKKK